MKNAIIQIDAAPFKQWYQQHYGSELGQKKGEDKAAAAAAETEAPKVSKERHQQQQLLLAYCGCCASSLDRGSCVVCCDRHCRQQ